MSSDAVENGYTTYEVSRSLGEGNLFFLHVLRFFIARNDILYIRFFLWVWLAGPICFEELLDTAVAGVDEVAAILDNAVFRLDFFQQMCDFSWQICH